MASAVQLLYSETGSSQIAEFISVQVNEPGTVALDTNSVPGTSQLRAPRPAKWSSTILYKQLGKQLADVQILKSIRVQHLID